MITNTNESKAPSSGEFIDIKKYIGVGSVNVVAVNPNNAQLRKFGWTIPETSPEPEYVTTDKDGKQNARVRFLVRLEELDNPVLAMDFFVRKEYRTSSSSGEQRVQVIDDFGRTAYVNQEQYKAHAIPEYSNGPASISSNYRMAHTGEADLIAFLMKYLNVTPTRMWDRNAGRYVDTKDPGKLTIDNWDKLCNGDVSEIKQYIALRPDNKVKVVFGIRTTSENRSYQAFITSRFIGNGAPIDITTGEYTAATTAINSYMNGRNPDSPVKLSFSAKPIQEWTVTATDVKDNSDEDMPDFSSPEFFKDDPNDLPFRD